MKGKLARVEPERIFLQLDKGFEAFRSQDLDSENFESKGVNLKDLICCASGPFGEMVRLEIFSPRVVKNR